MFGKSRGSIANANASTANTNSTNVNQNGASVSAIQQDWNDREFIEIVQLNIIKTAAFLNEFDITIRSRISQLNEKLSKLERSVDFCEAVIKSTQDRVKGNEPR
eukprot:gene14559-16122_t